MRKIYVVLIAAAFLASCKAGGNSPGYTFLFDMQYSRAYETYTNNEVFADGFTARMPVEGTIARGYMPLVFTAAEEDYAGVAKTTVNPVRLTEAGVASGKRLYDVYCAVCHGPTGAGDGSITTIGSYPPPPPYETRLPTITEGQMFHAITFGRNLMPPYANKLTVQERWNVVYYIQQLAGLGEFADGADPYTSAAATGAVNDTMARVMGADTTNTSINTPVNAGGAVSPATEQTAPQSTPTSPEN